MSDLNTHLNEAVAEIARLREENERLKIERLDAELKWGEINSALMQSENSCLDLTLMREEEILKYETLESRLAQAREAIQTLLDCRHADEDRCGCRKPALRALEEPK